MFAGKRNGYGSLFKKAVGYNTKEQLIYRGGWKNDLQHGQGTMFYYEDDVTNNKNNTATTTTTSGNNNNNKTIAIPNGNKANDSSNNSTSTTIENKIHFVGRFRYGKLHGRGTEFDRKGEKVSNI